MQKAQAAALRQVQDAEESLAQVIEANRESLVKANNEVRDAQLSLNEAIIAGQEEIQQLGFDAEDAALSEKRASIELNKARETLARAQDLPPNSRARQEAELAYQEADLNLRKAKDRSADLNKEQDRLAITGVAGTAVVISATNALAQAEADKTRTIRDGLRDEVKANQALAQAKTDAATAGDTGGSSGGGGGAPDPFAKLNDAQKKFAQFLIDLKPKIDELKNIAANGLLPPLQKAIELLVKEAYPTIATGVGIIAASVGAAAISLASAIVTTENLAKLSILFESSGRLISTFGTIAGSAYGVIFSILTATAPVAERFFNFLDEKLKTLDAFYNSPVGKPALTNFFTLASDAAAKFGEIFGNIFGGIGAIVMANIGPGTGGDELLNWLIRATDGFSQLASTPKKLANLKETFLALASNAESVFSAVGALLHELGLLGANPAIKETFDILKTGAPAVGTMAKAAVEAGPSLARLVVSLVEIAAKLADSGAATIFFDTLNVVATTINDFLSGPMVATIAEVIGRVLAFFSAIGLMVSLVVTGFGIVIAGVANFIGIFAPLLGIVSGVAGAFSGVTATVAGLAQGFAGLTYSSSGFLQIIGKVGFAALGPVGIIIGAIAAIIGAFVYFYNTSDSFKAQMDSVFSQLLTTVGGAFKTIMDAVTPLIPVVVGAGSSIMAAFSPLIPVIGVLLGGVISALVPIIGTLVSVIAEILAAVLPVVAALIGALVPAFTAIIGAVIPIVALIITTLLPVFTTLINAILPLISTIIGALLPVFTMIIEAVLPVITMIIGALVPAFTAIVDVIAAVLGVVLGILVPVLTTVIDVIAGVIAFILDPAAGVPVLATIFTTVFQAISDFVTSAITLIVDVVQTNIEFISSIWNTIWTNIGNFFKTVWSLIVLGVTIYISTVKTIITTILNVISGIWNGIWSGIGSFFKGVWDGILLAVQSFKSIFEGAFNGIAGFVTGAFSGVVGAVRGAINGVIGLVNNAIRALNRLKVTIPDFVPGIGGQTFGVNLATIPMLAKGGVVKATSGGMAAIIGEGGRNERIEPLDPQGLSKRDRALITLLAGDQKGITINVTQLPGQSGQELAEIISRELAAMMRKGA